MTFSKLHRVFPAAILIGLAAVSFGRAQALSSEALAAATVVALVVLPAAVYLAIGRD